MIKKVPHTSGLVTTTILNTKIIEADNKILDDAKYITTQQFNKLTAKYFAARLKEPDLVNKTDFDNKLTSFNKQNPSNKTKHLEVQQKLSSLITKYNIFFLGRIYFTSNDVTQNTFVYQPTLDALELKKKTKVLTMFLLVQVHRVLTMTLLEML